MSDFEIGDIILLEQILTDCVVFEIPDKEALFIRSGVFCIRLCSKKAFAIRGSAALPATIAEIRMKIHSSMDFFPGVTTVIVSWIYPESSRQQKHDRDRTKGAVVLPFQRKK